MVLNSCSQEEILYRAIDTLVRTNSDSVLRNGYRKRRANSGCGYVRGMSHAEQWCPNTSNGALLGAPWRQLLARVGDEIILHLLTHGSLFLGLGNGNYLQVTGRAINEVARERYQAVASARAGSVAAPAPSACAGAANTGAAPSAQQRLAAEAAVPVPVPLASAAQPTVPPPARRYSWFAATLSEAQELMRQKQLGTRRQADRQQAQQLWRWAQPQQHYLREQRLPLQQQHQQEQQLEQQQQDGQGGVGFSHLGAGVAGAASGVAVGGSRAGLAGKSGLEAGDTGDGQGMSDGAACGVAVVMEMEAGAEAAGAAAAKVAVKAPAPVAKRPRAWQRRKEAKQRAAAAAEAADAAAAGGGEGAAAVAAAAAVEAAMALAGEGPGSAPADSGTDWEVVSLNTLNAPASQALCRSPWPLWDFTYDMPDGTPPHHKKYGIRLLELYDRNDGVDNDADATSRRAAGPSGAADDDTVMADLKPDGGAAAPAGAAPPRRRGGRRRRQRRGEGIQTTAVAEEATAALADVAAAAEVGTDGGGGQNGAGAPLGDGIGAAAGAAADRGGQGLAAAATAAASVVPAATASTAPLVTAGPGERTKALSETGGTGARAGDGGSTAATTPLGPRLRSPHPAGWVPPSQQKIPRAHIFYCPTFGRRSGLPGKHMLRALQSGPRPHHRLFAHIFMQAALRQQQPGPPPPAPQQQLLPLSTRSRVVAARSGGSAQEARRLSGPYTAAQGRGGGGGGVGTQAPGFGAGGGPAAAAPSGGAGAVATALPVVTPGHLRPNLPTLRHHDVRRHAKLLQLLRQMLARAKRCPFGLLLEHHCPLPPALRRRQRDSQTQQQGQQSAGGQPQPQQEPQSHPGATKAAAAAAAAGPGPGLAAVCGVGDAPAPKPLGKHAAAALRTAPPALFLAGAGALTFQDVGDCGGGGDDGSLGGSPPRDFVPSGPLPITQLLPPSPGAQTSGPMVAQKELPPPATGAAPGTAPPSPPLPHGAVQRGFDGNGGGAGCGQGTSAPPPPVPVGSTAPPRSGTHSQQAGAGSKSQSAFERALEELAAGHEDGGGAGAASASATQRSSQSARRRGGRLGGPAGSSLGADGGGGKGAESEAGGAGTAGEGGGGEGQAAAKVDGSGGAGAGPSAGTPGGSLLPCCVPAPRVAAFLWSVVRHVVPPALLGDGRNRQVLHRVLHRFVSLRRHEHMTVHMAAQGLRTVGMTWLPALGTGRGRCGPGADTLRGRPRHRHVADQRLLASWVGWLLRDLSVPLLRANFYVTESEPYRQQVFYYRKPVWARLQAAAVRDLLDNRLQAIPRSEAQRLLSSRPLGPARLRLVPKMAGMRPIVNLGKPTKLRFPQPRRKQGAAAAAGAMAPPSQRRRLLSAGSAGAVTAAAAATTVRSGAAAAAGSGVAVAMAAAAAAVADAGAADMELEQGPAAEAGGGAGLPGAGVGGRGGAGGRKRPAGQSGDRREAVTLSFRSFNNVLQNAQLALKASLERRPGVLGCSVFGLDGIYRSYAPFVRSLRAAASAAPAAAAGAGAAPAAGSAGPAVGAKRRQPPEHRNAQPLQRPPRRALLRPLRPLASWLPQWQRQQQKPQQKQQQPGGRAAAVRTGPGNSPPRSRGEVAATSTDGKGPSTTPPAANAAAPATAAEVAAALPNAAPVGPPITAAAAWPAAAPDFAPATAEALPAGAMAGAVTSAVLPTAGAAGPTAALPRANKAALGASAGGCRGGQEPYKRKWQRDPGSSLGLCAARSTRVPEDERLHGPHLGSELFLRNGRHAKRRRLTAPGESRAAATDVGRDCAALQTPPSSAQPPQRAAAAAATAAPPAPPPPSLSAAVALPAVYMVCADISKAYDSMLQRRLMPLVEPLLDQPDYLIIRGAEVSPSVGLHGVRSRPANAAHPGSRTYPGFPAWLAAHRAAAGGEAFNTVFLDKLPQQRPVPRSEVVSLLRQAVSDNLLRIGRIWYRQATGIAQGAITSTLLCSLYMAALEQQHLLPLLPRAGVGEGGPAARSATNTPAVIAAAAPPPPPLHVQQQVPQQRRRGRRGGRRLLHRHHEAGRQPLRPPPRDRHPPRDQHHGDLQPPAPMLPGHPPAPQPWQQRPTDGSRQPEPMQIDSTAAPARVNAPGPAVAAGLWAPVRPLPPRLPPLALRCSPPREAFHGRAAATGPAAASTAGTPTATSHSDGGGLTALAAALSAAAAAAAASGSVSVSGGGGAGSGGGRLAQAAVAVSVGMASPTGASDGRGGGSPKFVSHCTSSSRPGSGSKSVGGFRASGERVGSIDAALHRDVAPLAALALATAAAAATANPVAPGRDQPGCAQIAAAPQVAQGSPTVPAPPPQFSLPHHLQPRQRLAPAGLLQPLQQFVGVGVLASRLLLPALPQALPPLEQQRTQGAQFEGEGAQWAVAWDQTPPAPGHCTARGSASWSADVHGNGRRSGGGAGKGGQATGSAGARRPSAAPRTDGSPMDDCERQTPIEGDPGAAIGARAHGDPRVAIWQPGLPPSAVPGSRASVVASAQYRVHVGFADAVGIRGGTTAAGAEPDGPRLAGGTPLRRFPLALSQSQSQPQQSQPRPPPRPLALSQAQPRKDGDHSAQQVPSWDSSQPLDQGHGSGQRQVEPPGATVSAGPPSAGPELVPCSAHIGAQRLGSLPSLGLRAPAPEAAGPQPGQEQAAAAAMQPLSTQSQPEPNPQQLPNMPAYKQRPQTLRDQLPTAGIATAQPTQPLVPGLDGGGPAGQRANAAVAIGPAGTASAAAPSSGVAGDQEGDGVETGEGCAGVGDRGGLTAVGPEAGVGGAAQVRSGTADASLPPSLVAAVVLETPMPLQLLCPAAQQPQSQAPLQQPSLQPELHPQRLCQSPALPPPPPVQQQDEEQSGQCQMEQLAGPLPLPIPLPLPLLPLQKPVQGLPGAPDAGRIAEYRQQQQLPPPHIGSDSFDEVLVPAGQGPEVLMVAGPGSGAGSAVTNRAGRAANGTPGGPDSPPSAFTVSTSSASSDGVAITISSSSTTSEESDCRVVLVVSAPEPAAAAVVGAGTLAAAAGAPPDTPTGPQRVTAAHHQQDDEEEPPDLRLNLHDPMSPQIRSCLGAAGLHDCDLGAARGEPFGGWPEVGGCGAGPAPGAAAGAAASAGRVAMEVEVIDLLDSPPEKGTDSIAVSAVLRNPDGQAPHAPPPLPRLLPPPQQPSLLGPAVGGAAPDGRGEYGYRDAAGLCLLTQPLTQQLATQPSSGSLSQPPPSLLGLPLRPQQQKQLPLHTAAHVLPAGRHTSLPGGPRLVLLTPHEGGTELRGVSWAPAPLPPRPPPRPTLHSFALQAIAPPGTVPPDTIAAAFAAAAGAGAAANPVMLPEAPPATQPLPPPTDYFVEAARTVAVDAMAMPTRLNADVWARPSPMVPSTLPLRVAAPAVAAAEAAVRMGTAAAAVGAAAATLSEAWMAPSQAPPLTDRAAAAVGMAADARGSSQPAPTLDLLAPPAAAVGQALYARVELASQYVPTQPVHTQARPADGLLRPADSPEPQEQQERLPQEVGMATQPTASLPQMPLTQTLLFGGATAQQQQHPNCRHRKHLPILQEQPFHTHLHSPPSPAPHATTWNQPGTVNLSVPLAGTQGPDAGPLISTTLTLHPAATAVVATDADATQIVGAPGGFRNRGDHGELGCVSGGGDAVCGGGRGSGPSGAAAASGATGSGSLCCGYSDEDVWLRVGRAAVGGSAGSGDNAPVHGALVMGQVMGSPDVGTASAAVGADAIHVLEACDGRSGDAAGPAAMEEDSPEMGAAVASATGTTPAGGAIRTAPTPVAPAMAASMPAAWAGARGGQGSRPPGLQTPASKRTLADILRVVLEDTPSPKGDSPNSSRAPDAAAVHVAEGAAARLPSPGPLADPEVNALPPAQAPPPRQQNEARRHRGGQRMQWKRRRQHWKQQRQSLGGSSAAAAAAVTATVVQPTAAGLTAVPSNMALGGTVGAALVVTAAPEPCAHGRGGVDSCSRPNEKPVTEEVPAACQVPSVGHRIGAYSVAAGPGRGVLGVSASPTAAAAEIAPTGTDRAWHLAGLGGSGLPPRLAGPMSQRRGPQPPGKQSTMLGARPRPPQQHPQLKPQPALRPDSLLMRLIDDFFILTTSRAAAEAVARRLQEGFREDYGCTINPGKTQANFLLPSANHPPVARLDEGPRGGQVGSGASVEGQAIAGGDNAGAAANAGAGGGVVHLLRLGVDGSGECAEAGCNVWQAGDGRRYLRWCGLLFNVVTLEVQADYSRYAGTHIRTTMSVPADARPGRQLAAKMCQYLRPKAHALLLDTSINTPGTVRLNIFQSFLLAAIKMHWYLRCVPRGLASDPRVVLSAIQSGVAYMVTLVRSRTSSAVADRRFGPGCRCDVSSCHVRWLGLFAFRRVLLRKQSCYPLVLACLDRQLAAPAFRHLPRQLAAVVSDDANALFSEIRY